MPANAGATYWRLSGDMTSGTFDRLASLWFVASCVVLQPGNNACTIMCAGPPDTPCIAACFLPWVTTQWEVEIGWSSLVLILSYKDWLQGSA